MNSSPEIAEREDLEKPYDEAGEDHALNQTLDNEMQSAPVHVEGDHLRAITTAVANLMVDRQRVDDQVGQLASRLEYWYQHVLKLGEVLEGMQTTAAATAGVSNQPGAAFSGAPGSTNPAPAPPNAAQTAKRSTQSLPRSSYSTTQSLSHIAKRLKGGTSMAATVGRTTGRITTNIAPYVPGSGVAASGGNPSTGEGAMLDAASAQKLTELYDEAAGFATEVAGMLGSLLEERAAFHQTSRQISLQLSMIQSVPAESLLRRLAAAFKTEAATLEKTIALTLDGEETPVDKPLLEEIYVPLLELLKHTMHRSVEDPLVRKACGKPDEANITISVQHEGTRIVIRMEDDGSGIDTEDLWRNAMGQKKISPKATWDPTLFAWMLCSPEIHPLTESISRLVDAEALSWIQRGIHRLRGSIALESLPGRGSTWNITLPVNALQCEGAIVDAGGVPVVVSSVYVQGGFQLDDARIEWREGRPFYPGPSGYAVELWRLDALLGMAPVEPAPAEGIYLETDGVTIAVAVQKIMGCRDVTVKPFITLPEQHPLFSCAAMDLDGKVLLVANVPGLFQARFAMLGGGEDAADSGDVGI
ncbi:MAG: hypothetical protein ACAI35_07035 [Candidatus Methylacidiphilales bacterium]|nr:hypothetical protein [Candidatus Methylacidiphilales bacterium]